jgi:hypothetical protein
MFIFPFPNVSYREITAYAETHTDSVQYFNDVQYQSGL